MLDLGLITLAQAEVDAPPVVSQPAPSIGPAPAGGVEAAPGTSPAPGNPPASPPPGSGAGNFSFLLIILIFVAFWFILMGGQRREKKKRAAMLAALSKGAKVQTIGGILGTIVEVREDEVVVKVDENSGTRLRMAKNAIQSVLEDKQD